LKKLIVSLNTMQKMAVDKTGIKPRRTSEKALKQAIPYLPSPKTKARNPAVLWLKDLEAQICIGGKQMVFSSSVFLFLFLPVVLLGYYVLFRKSRRWQNIFLTVASLGFYAWGEPVFVLAMLGSIAANWLLGLALEKSGEKARKAVVAASVGFTSACSLFSSTSRFSQTPPQVLRSLA
jgi:hypothetical protein